MNEPVASSVDGGPQILAGAFWINAVNDEKQEYRITNQLIAYQDFLFQTLPAKPKLAHASPRLLIRRRPS